MPIQYIKNIQSSTLIIFLLTNLKISTHLKTFITDGKPLFKIVDSFFMVKSISKMTNIKIME